jgi:hypothetical protein
MTQYCIKSLTRADMMFFEHHFRSQSLKCRKSIALDASVLVEQMFPYIRSLPSIGRTELPVFLSIYGPGLRFSPDHKTRMISGASRIERTWHLNGESIPDPDDDPTRYHKLKAGDLAIFAFDSCHFRPVPSTIAMALLSQAEPVDAQLLNDFTACLAGRRMALLPFGTFVQVCSTSSVEHPIHSVLYPELPSI